MKKTYIIPMLSLTHIVSEQLIAESLGVHKDTPAVSEENGGWTKGSSSDNNVWSDIWSE